MTELNIDTVHSSLGFAVKHMVVSTVRGKFNTFGGQVTVEGSDPTTARGEVTVAVGSIDTGDEKRDGHLRSADFFDAATHPEARFVIVQVTPKGDQHFAVQGELTIRGTTRDITLDVERSAAINDPWGNERYGLTVRAELDRRDFGLTWNQVLEAGAVLVGERVKIEGEIAVVRPLAVAA